MVKKAKKEHYQNIIRNYWQQEVLENSKLPNKVKTNQKINLTEKNVLVASDEKITKTFKK